MIFQLKQCFPRIFFRTNIALQSNGKPICCSLTGTSWYLKRGFLFSSWYKGHIGDSNYHTSGIHKNKLGSYVNGLQSSTRRNFATKLWLSLTKMSIENGESDQQTGHLPSGYVKIAIENGPVEIVDLPIKNSDFPLKMAIYSEFSH
jgi:hypothetical protein